MIKSVTVTNYLGDTIKLELTRPDKTGFIIESIEGLGPAKANVNTTKMARTDGSKYNSAYLDQRDIVMNLKFSQDTRESIEDIRQKSYKYFPIKRSVKLLVETDNRLAEVEGYVESNEPNIFSKFEGCSITIICPDPFFYSTATDITALYGVEPTFEFPFEHNSVRVINDEYFDDGPLFELGVIHNQTEGTVYYEGESEVGMTIVIYASGEVVDITIYNISTREQMRINTSTIEKLTGSGVIAGDTIFIKTRKGGKSITLLREGVTYNILNAMDKRSNWFTLMKGDNILAYTAATGESEIQFTIENKIVYDGV